MPNKIDPEDYRATHIPEMVDPPTKAPPRPVNLNTANGRTIKPKLDMVDHPPHYNNGTMEAIEIIEAANLDYHRSNALKYIIRSPYKGSERQDLEKAIWYLNRYIERYLDAES